MKTCKACGSEKYQMPCGVWACRPCKKVRAAAYLKANRAKERARIERWKANNREHVRNYFADWREANRETVREYFAAYKEENRDRMAEVQRQYRKRNRERINAQDLAKWHRRRARQKAALGCVSSNIREILWQSQSGLCAVCCANLADAGSNLDHIVALSRGGAHDDSNLQLLCPPCNFQKGARDLDEFLRVRAGRVA